MSYHSLHIANPGGEYMPACVPGAAALSRNGSTLSPMERRRTLSYDGPITTESLNGSRRLPACAEYRLDDAFDERVELKLANPGADVDSGTAVGGLKAPSLAVGVISGTAMNGDTGPGRAGPRSPSAVDMLSRRGEPCGWKVAHERGVASPTPAPNWSRSSARDIFCTSERAECTLGAGLMYCIMPGPRNASATVRTDSMPVLRSNGSGPYPSTLPCMLRYFCTGRALRARAAWLRRRRKKRKPTSKRRKPRVPPTAAPATAARFDAALMMLSGMHGKRGSDGAPLSVHSRAVFRPAVRAAVVSTCR